MHGAVSCYNTHPANLDRHSACACVPEECLYYRLLWPPDHVRVPLHSMLWGRLDGSSQPQDLRSGEAWAKGRGERRCRFMKTGHSGVGQDRWSCLDSLPTFVLWVIQLTSKPVINDVATRGPLPWLRWPPQSGLLHPDQQTKKRFNRLKMNQSHRDAIPTAIIPPCLAKTLLKFTYEGDELTNE